MPRAKLRRRIVLCDCRDCVDVNQGPIDYTWEPAARQLPPPRSLIVLLEGFNADPATSSTCCRIDEVTLPHFDNVARKGVTFSVATPTGLFLVTCLCTPIRCTRAAGNSKCHTNLKRPRCLSAGPDVPLLSRLLGCHGSNADPAQHSIPAVFKGMQCAVASTSTSDMDAARLQQVHRLDFLCTGSCKCVHQLCMV